MKNLTLADELVNEANLKQDFSVEGFSSRPYRLEALPAWLFLFPEDR